MKFAVLLILETFAVPPFPSKVATTVAADGSGTLWVSWYPFVKFCTAYDPFHLPPFGFTVNVVLLITHVA